MSISKAVNLALRITGALKHSLGKFTPSRRLFSTNFLILLLLFIVVLQSVRSYNRQEDSHAHVFLLKDAKYSQLYNPILKKFKPGEFTKLSLQERCDTYFDQLSLDNSQWKFDNFDTSNHDDNYVDLNDFIKFKKNADNNLVLNEETLGKLEKEFYEKSTQSSSNVDKIIDAVTTLRIFGKCYLENDAYSSSSVFGDNSLLSGKSKKGSNVQELCHDTEARLFPWFTGILPVYTRWNGDSPRGLPDLKDSSVLYDEYNDAEEFKKNSKRDTNTRSNCFFKNFKDLINGRGIVLSASDHQKDDVMRLALLLRATNNKLPIQIVHKGDLSEKSQKQLINQFRRTIDVKKLPNIYEELKLPTDLKFPKQEVWFVNVKQSINEKFSKHFESYANKLLAYLFNSFDEIFLIDTDTVPFVELETIMNFPGYKEKGAFFFGDRKLRVQRTQNQINYFKKLFPSEIDHYFFDIPMLTNFTLENRYIGSLRFHLMESGVVAIKRSTHFTGILTSFQLNFWQTTNTKIHGDKELFWLGQSISGNENYEFNALGAASVGEVSGEYSRFPDSPFKEICSNHPAHVNGYDNKTLLWMNSGYTFCKNTGGAKHDAGKGLFKDYTESQLLKFYTSMSRIRAAIVPPPQEIPGKNDDNDPDEGWANKHKYCEAYTWCAYSGVGSHRGKNEKGLFLKFNEQEVNWFDFLGTIWMNDIKE